MKDIRLVIIRVSLGMLLLAKRRGRPLCVFNEFQFTFETSENSLKWIGD